MALTTMNEINKKYDFELDKIVNEIKENKAKNVVLQFPDGLKQYANIIIDYLEEKVNNSETGKNVTFLIWLGSCYGACDYPLHLENLKGEEKIDLVVQFGHNEKMPEFLK